MIMFVSIYHRLINFIDTKAKCHPKNRPIKGLSAGFFQPGDTFGHVGIFDPAL